MVKKDCMNCIYHRFFIENMMNIKKERKLWKQRYVEAVKGSRFLTKFTTKGNTFPTGIYYKGQAKKGAG